MPSLVGSEMCIRDRRHPAQRAPTPQAFAGWRNSGPASSAISRVQHVRATFLPHLPTACCGVGTQWIDCACTGGVDPPRRHNTCVLPSHPHCGYLGVTALFDMLVRTMSAFDMSCLASLLPLGLPLGLANNGSCARVPGKMGCITSYGIVRSKLLCGK